MTTPDPIYQKCLEKANSVIEDCPIYSDGKHNWTVEVKEVELREKIAKILYKQEDEIYKLRNKIRAFELDIYGADAQKEIERLRGEIEYQSKYSCGVHEQDQQRITSLEAELAEAKRVGKLCAEALSRTREDWGYDADKKSREALSEAKKEGWVE